jgi:protein SCO1/2
MVLAAPLRAQSPPENPQKSLLSEVRFDQRLDTLLPLELTFRDERGAVRPLRMYFGEKPVVLALVYYRCPMLCTQVLNGLVTSLRALELSAGKDFEVVLVSIDPRETPAMALKKKQSYLHRYGRPESAAGWHFLTGDQENIERLAAAVGYQYRYDPKSDQYAHASGLMVLTPQGRLARYFYGIDYPTRDLRLSLVEASAGKIGSPVDQVLLFCFHYDPATGRYGLAIVRLLRVAGMLTVAALGSFVALSLWRERRRRRVLHSPDVHDRSAPLSPVIHDRGAAS